MSIYKIGATSDLNGRGETETFQIANDGIITAVISYNYTPTGNGTKEPLEQITWNEAHPDYSYLKLTGANITRTKANVYTVTKTYQGAIDDDSLTNGIITTRVNTDTVTDPIEAHPEFYEKDDGAGGTTDGFGKDHGKFEDDDTEKRFLYFAGDADHSLGGVKSFLAPNLTGVGVVVQHLDSGYGWNTDYIYNIGKRILSNANLITILQLPDIGTRNWLLTKVTQERLGGALRMTLTLKMSGANGWNTEIYPAAT